MKAQSKKILVTGGAGFIGAHTVIAIYQSGGLPVIIDNFSNSERFILDGIAAICGQPPRFYEGDCADADFLNRVFAAEGHIAGVIHFAAFKSIAESLAHPGKYYRNNLGSLLTLIEAMIRWRTSALVFSSSCTVYGSPDRCPVVEDSPIRETPSPYGKTKQICEQIIRDTVRAKANITAVALRYFNPVGAHPSGLIGELPIGIPDSLVPYLIQTASGTRERLTIFGGDYHTPDGTCVRDFVHVVDVAEAHAKAFAYLDRLGAPRCFEAFNIGTGEGNSVLQVVKTFARVNGIDLNYVIGGRRDGDVEAVYANVDRAERLMGWKAKLTLPEAMVDAWNWQKHLMARVRSAGDPGQLASAG